MIRYVADSRQSEREWEVVRERGREGIEMDVHTIEFAQNTVDGAGAATAVHRDAELVGVVGGRHFGWLVLVVWF